MANLKSKNAPPELEQDWHNLDPDPDKPSLARINKLIGLSEMRQSEQLLKVSKMEEQELLKTVEPVQLSKVFGYDNKTKKWSMLGYKCWSCGKLLREGRITEKHPLICKRTLKINTEEEEILKLVRKSKTDANT